MSSSTAKLSRQRKRKFEEDPYCPNCGVEMVMPPIEKHITCPPNMVTIEHKYSRYFPEKRLNAGPFSRTILCSKCNQKNADADALFVGIEELHRRSTH